MTRHKWLFPMVLSLCLLLACVGKNPGKKTAFHASLGDNMKLVVQRGHSGAISGIAFSGDGRFLVSGSIDASLVLWEVATGRQLHTFRGHTDAVLAVAMSPDGEYIISGSKDKTAILWRVRDGVTIKSFGPFANAVTAVAISPEGEFALTGDRNGNIQQWRIPSGKLLRTYKSNYQSFAVKERYQQWNKSTNPKKRDVMALIFPQMMHYQSTSKKHALSKVEGHLASVLSFSFTDKRNFVSVGGEGVVLKSGRFLKTIYRTHRENQRVSIATSSPNGVFVITGNGDNSLMRWDLSKANQPTTLDDFPQSINTAVVSLDSQKLLVAGDNGFLALCRSTNGHLLKTFIGPKIPIRTIGMTPDGRYVAAGYPDGTIRTWKTKSRLSVETFAGRAEQSRELLLMSDNRFLVSANDDGTLKLWDIRKAEQLRLFRGHHGAVLTAALSHDERQMVSGGADGSIIVWDIYTGRKLKEINTGVEKILRLAYTLDGNQVVSAGSDKVVKLWDIRNGRKVFELPSFDFPITCLAISADGGVAVVGTEGKRFSAWHLRTGERIAIFSGHFGGIHSLAFSPDGRFILSGGGDKKVRLWDVATGKAVDTFTGYQTTVTAVTFSADGHRIYTGSRDGVITIRDASNGNLIKSVSGHDGRITALAIPAKGDFIMSAGADATTRIWHSGDLDESICLHSSGDGEWAVTTTDGYYKTSPEGNDLVHWVTTDSQESFSFEQFEHFSKRPDIIDKRLNGDANAGIPFPKLMAPPAIYLAHHMEVLETTERTFPIHLTVSAITPVDSVRLFINGRPLVETPVGEIEKEMQVTIPLFAGVNRITVIAYDANGFSSNARYVDVICKAPKLKLPNLHILAVGINAYPRLPSQWQLHYAGTDAERIVSTFSSQKGKLFADISNTLLIDENATLANIVSSLEALDRIDTNDLTVIFMAGHGVRGRSDKFYFLTAGGSLQAPSEGGVSWETLTQSLEKIQGRVILFLDACHSGSIVNETVAPNNELAEQFFAGKSGGIMVFSASKGRQYSFESPDFGEGAGVFTYAITQGIGEKSNIVDINGNGFVEFMELVYYVKNYVDQETNGEQTPWLSRMELFGDLPIAVVSQF